MGQEYATTSIITHVYTKLGSRIKGEKGGKAKKYVCRLKKLHKSDSIMTHGRI